MSWPLQSKVCTLDMACFAHDIHSEAARELHGFRGCRVLMALLMRRSMAQVVGAACG